MRGLMVEGDADNVGGAMLRVSTVRLSDAEGVEGDADNVEGQC